MKIFFDGVLKLSKGFQTIAGISLSFMVFLTTLDVVIRLFGKPVPGAVEIIAICGGIVVGFAVPISFIRRSHIAVDIVLNILPPAARKVVYILTRFVAIGLCCLIGWNFFKIGKGLLKGGEVSGTLQIPLYPICYALGACFFVLIIVLFCDILKSFGGSHE